MLHLQIEPIFFAAFLDLTSSTSICQCVQEMDVAVGITSAEFVVDCATV